MNAAVLINGEPTEGAGLVTIDDRGFTYGDGLFETIRVSHGRPMLLNRHLARLRSGCLRLGIDYPGERVLADEVAVAVGADTDAVIKIVLTRGRGQRGYRPTPGVSTTRIVQRSSVPEPGNATIAVRWCATRLGRNATLAGMKHLNRLEQVLAQREWNEPAVQEGLMLDTEGEVICGTMSNVFIVRDGVLITPDLRYCGVQGVMRAEVLHRATKLGVTTQEAPLWPRDLESASEVFVTNAIRGIRPVTLLGGQRWSSGSITHKLQGAVLNAMTV